MITRITISELEAKKNTDARSAGFEVLFNVEDVKIEGELVKVKYVYTANYRGNAGHIKIKGELTAKEDKDAIKKIEGELKGKKLPPEYMQKVINAVNYFGTTNATLVASVMNMVPPIKMPVLQLRQGEKKG